VTRRFENYVAIDWSGAAGERHRGLALAQADAVGGPPAIVRSGHRWSRPEILAYLLKDLPPDTLVGLDLGISLPYADCGAFFPGWEQSPGDAKSLWALVDRICTGDPYLAAASFTDHPEASRYFRRPGAREGAAFHHPYSNFNLVGAAQVGKSSLTGMRVLNRLGGAFPVWPMDALPGKGPAIVEIYTAIAAVDAGRLPSRSKMRSFEDLNQALRTLDSPVVAGTGPLDDHSADALLTAAWLRMAAIRPDLWVPAGLTRQIAVTEGWTFGVP
jgi:hypothetical protein